MDFAKNASDFFGPKQITAMKAAYGEQWAAAVKDSLRRIVTGKNQPSKQTAATRALDKWINRTVGLYVLKHPLSGTTAYFNWKLHCKRPESCLCGLECYETGEGYGERLPKE